MLPILWGLLGASGAVYLEYLYLTTEGSWWRLLPVIVPLQLIVSRSIWEIVKSDNILAVPVFFSFGTALLRITATSKVGGDVSQGTWIAFCLVLVAVSIKLGERFLK